ncbi:PBECR2 nuclease fold domain-containing protein, partial [Helicobacter suis]|uniref:PBECR2 nuclease fold domain-containing protein n=1 Tax=Helicobacter suis TaxID=104628 RepID=UPI00196827C2
MINDLAKQRVKQEAKKKRELNKSLYTQWKDAFNLKNTNEPFIPKFAPEVKEALEGVLHGEQIKLTQGSLYKLVKRSREELLPYIRPTLENPNMVLDDSKGLLFIKEFIDPDKNRYFMSVAKNYNGEWIFSSHTRRELATIKKELANSKVLYNKGFKSGEVAGASDMLKSGGTAMKPSDLQINTPLHPSSGLNPEKRVSQEGFKSQENNPTQMAIKSPVFENKPNQAKQAQKADKIFKEYYTTDEDISKFWEFWKNLGLRKSDKMFMPNIAIDAKNALRHTGITDIYFDQAGLARDFKIFSNLKKQLEAIVNPDIILRSKERNRLEQIRNWIRFFKTNPDDTVTTIHITLADRKGDNLYKINTRKPDSISHAMHNLKTTLDQTEAKKMLDEAFSQNNVIYYKTQRQEIPHNKAFGTNFEQFYHNPKGAIAKLLESKEGQVAGAFYREDLGDIDLVWGASATDLKDLKDVKGKPLKPYGLSKIVEKHLDDFKGFEGNNAYEKLGNGLDHLVKNG